MTRPSVSRTTTQLPDTNIFSNDKEARYVCLLLAYESLKPKFAAMRELEMDDIAQLYKIAEDNFRFINNEPLKIISTEAQQQHEKISAMVRKANYKS